MESPKKLGHQPGSPSGIANFYSGHRHPGFQLSSLQPPLLGALSQPSSSPSYWIPVPGFSLWDQFPHLHAGPQVSEGNLVKNHEWL